MTSYKETPHEHGLVLKRKTHVLYFYISKKLSYLFRVKKQLKFK